ncbi:Flagellar hook-associated protein 2 [compost metagenome]
MGPLSGDASVRSMLSSIRNELVAPSGNSQLSILAELGVYTDSAARDGTLTLDATKFDKAVATKGGQVASLFTGENGLLSRMTKAMEPYSVTGGILDTRSNLLTADKVRLNEQQAALDRRIESLTETLSKKYTAMDGLVAKIRATSSNILTTLNALNNQKSD